MRQDIDIRRKIEEIFKYDIGPGQNIDIRRKIEEIFKYDIGPGDEKFKHELITLRDI